MRCSHAPVLIVCLLVACGSPPSLTPDLADTQATTAAGAPAPTDRAPPTPTPTSTQPPTPAPTDTPPPAPTEPPTSTPTATDTPAPTATPTEPRPTPGPPTATPTAAPPAATPVPTAPLLTLPGHIVTAYHAWMGGTTSEFDLGLSGIGPGFSISDGTYPGWCLEDNFQDNHDQVRLFSSYDPNMPDDAKHYRNPTIPKGALGQLVPWDKLNYLLNHKQGGIRDVGAAIWLLLWGTTTTFPASAEAQVIVAGAEAHGAGFVPGPGQMMGVILYQDGLGDDLLPDDRDRSFQHTVIEVRIP